MAKNTINILCPSGHRRKTTMTPNSNLLQALEDICNQEGLDSSEWGLIYQRNKCDLNKQWRLQNIPTNAILEMYKLDDRRKADDIHVQLELPDNSRYAGWFEPTVTLQEMLDWYRIQPDSMVAALDISLADNYNSCPICSYMGQEIIGDYALSNTTLRELGLTSGTAVIRYNLRPISDNELLKLNKQIDEKISRRHQQQYEHEQKSKQSQQQPATPKPAPTIRSSTSDASRSLINSTVPPTNEAEYSIFHDPPPSASLPASARSQRQSLTLAEELGLNFSLDLERKVDSQQKQTDFRNFKFPESTKGKELYRNDFDEDYQQAQLVKPCDRRPLAYDLLRNRPTRDTQRNRSEELPDSFFELTAEDLRSVLDTLRKQSTTENPLETRRMRDRVQSAHNIAYEQISIRLVINSRYVLQGLFRPEEPTLRLIDFARTTLVCPHIGDKDFYFYISPPRVILSDLRKPLSAYDLAPAAFVYLGHRTISPLKVELASNVPMRTIDEANQLAVQYVFSRSRPGNGREYSTLYNDRPMSATSLVVRPTTRNQPTNKIDDKQLREKFRKFLPGKK